MRKCYLIYMLVVLTAFFCACEHHELFYSNGENATVRINIDWSKTEISPNGVTPFAFYSSTGELYREFSTSGNLDYVDVSLPEGTYDIVLINNSTSEFSYIDFSGKSNISTFLGSAKLASAVREVSKSDQDKDVVADPDVLTSVKVENISVTKQMVEFHEDLPDAYSYTIEKELGVVMERRVVEVTIVANVTNIASVPNAPMTFFKHFSGGYYPGLEHNESREVMHEFLFNNRQLVNDDKDAIISTRFNSFGKVDDLTATYELDIAFVLANGEDFPVIVDVTDQTTEYMDGNIKRIYIEIDIDLPVVTSSGDVQDDSGFEAEVDDWDEVLQDMVM